MLKHLKHFCQAVKYSMQGSKNAAGSEIAFRQEIMLLFLLPLAGLLYGVPAPELLLPTAGWLTVMALELLNTAIENICNLVSPDFNPLVKKAKDAASAAVLLGIFANAAHWLYLVCRY